MKKTRLLFVAAIMCAFSATALHAKTKPIDQSELCPVELADEFKNQQKTPALDLSQLPVKDTLNHNNFIAEYPDVCTSEIKDGLGITRCDGDGYSLRGIICPVALEENGLELMAAQLEAVIDLESRRMTNIGGLELMTYDGQKIYSDSDSDSDQDYCVLYALNAGEQTYIFFQQSKIPSEWWTNHIKWKFDGKTTKTPSELLSSFNAFLKEMMKGLHENDINIAEETGAIRISFTENEQYLYKDRAAKTLYALIKNFTVFNAFGTQKYDFIMEHLDSEGTQKAEFTFPHSLYSRWSDYDQFLKSLDDNLPEGTHETPHRAIGG